MKKEKTEGQIKRKIYDLLPDTVSVKSAKIILVLLQCFRKMTEFKGSYGKIKNALLETVKGILDKKTFVKFDCVDFLPFINNCPLNDIKGMQEAIYNAVPLSLWNIYQLENGRNRDYKAVTFGEDGTAVQQIAGNTNSLESRRKSSNHQKNIHYVVTQELLDKGKKMLEGYLFTEKKSIGVSKAFFSKNCK